MNEKLVNYIRANKGTYTRLALTKQLLEQGYSASDIDEAWDALEEEAATKNLPQDNLPQRSVWGMSDYWFAALGFFLGIPVVIGIISRIFRYSSNYDAFGFSFTLAVFLIIAALIACVIGIVVLWNTNRAVSRGLLFGFVLFLIPPFVGLIIILGICTAG